MAEIEDAIVYMKWYATPSNCGIMFQSMVYYITEYDSEKDKCKINIERP